MDGAATLGADEHIWRPPAARAGQRTVAGKLIVMTRLPPQHGSGMARENVVITADRVAPKALPRRPVRVINRTLPACGVVLHESDVRSGTL